MREAVIANVRQQVAELNREPSIKAALAADLRLTSAASGWMWRSHLA